MLLGRFSLPGPPALEVFLGHFGGPYWQNKDEGAWTFPKGLIESDEEPLDAARRLALNLLEQEESLSGGTKNKGLRAG